MSVPATKAILTADRITKSYPMPKGHLQVLKEISLSFTAGELVAIVGPSGVGKSTLLHILGALDKPTTGQVRIGEIDTVQLDDKAMARARNGNVGFVFQFHHLLPEFSAIENVMMPALIAGQTDTGAAPRAKELLTQVGLSARLQHRPNELSGGEQQRVAVARALMNEPQLILADEPSGNLDQASSNSLHELIITLAREKKQTFIIVTHNESLAKRADRVITMYDGTIASDTWRIKP